MAFEKRTWLARIGQGLNKFIIGAKDGEGKQTLTNSPDSVTQQGDVISSENLNDLEDRIEAEFTSQYARINNKADISYVNSMKLTKIWENPYPAGLITTEWSLVLDIHPPFSLMIEYSLDVYSWTDIPTNGNRSFAFLKKLADNANICYTTLSYILGYEDPVQNVPRLTVHSRHIRFQYSTGTNKTTMTIEKCWDYEVNNSTPSVEVAGRYLVPQAVYLIGDIYNSEEA